MEQPEEKQPQPGGLRGFFRGTRNNFRWLYDFVDEVWVKFNNLTETNYDLACQMVQQGRVDDAIWRFKITLLFSPDHLLTLYNLGCIYRFKGMQKEALECFTKVLKQDPKHENAIYMVATINPSMVKANSRPRVYPAQLAIEYFDSVAAGYDYEQQLASYQLIPMLHQFMHNEYPSDMIKHDMVDLGCGTGLCGYQFQGEFSNLVGVDISAEMLDQAYRKMDRRGVKIYNRLAHEDLRQFMKDSPPTCYDAALCIQVFKYLGDLQPVFAGLSHVMRTSGLFACSFDPYRGNDGFGVMPETGYFGHNINYVLQLAEQYGFEAVRTGEVLAYPQQHVQLCIFRKLETATHEPATDTPAESGEPPAQ